ncbi:Protein ALP1-like [Merluccius polli]|uniref:Protein ALP1-like n=1 Tax=Merluccius polli TaxID=89951 RepID=A0AA47P6Q8_MERPO|nr:Protein ALP1-like [Merluccius polli]
MRSLDEERHFQYFRMSAPKFDDLVSRVIRYLPDSHQNHRNPIGASQRLAVTLRYLATGIGLQALSASYKMGTSTVSGIVEEMCSAIWDALQGEYMAFPSRGQWQDIAEDFRRQWQFPLCVGAIDGKHVRIRAPARSGSDFHNYKGFFSIVLMAAADANYIGSFMSMLAHTGVRAMEVSWVAVPSDPDWQRATSIYPPLLSYQAPQHPVLFFSWGMRPFPYR